MNDRDTRCDAHPTCAALQCCRKSNQKMFGTADKTERTALKRASCVRVSKSFTFFRPGLAAISGDRRASPAKDEAKESWLIYPGNAAWCGVAWRCGVWHVGVVCGMAVGEQVSNHAVNGRWCMQCANRTVRLSLTFAQLPQMVCFHARAASLQQLNH